VLFSFLQRSQRAKDAVIKSVLAALIKAAEMTHHTAFLKADGLSAFRAFFSH
jgi:hypothetical protein